jgi:hypothetical protein
MTYVDEVWFFLFAPGKRDCIVGSSGRISRTEQHYDNTIFAKWAADETAMAQEFDVKLEQEVSRGMARFVSHTKKLGGWQASTGQSNLEFSEYANAIMALPGSHPAHHALMDSVLGSFSR